MLTKRHIVESVTTTPSSCVALRHQTRIRVSWGHTFSPRLSKQHEAFRKSSSRGGVLLYPPAPMNIRPIDEERTVVKPFGNRGV